MSETGHIIGGPTDPDYDGAVLTADVSVGDMVLHVDDTADFDEDAGERDGRVLLGVELDADGNLDPAVGTAVAYTTCDDDSGTVTLVSPSTVAASSGDRVYIENPVTGEPVGRAEVDVAIDDSDTTGDALTAYVDVALLDSVGDVDLTDLAVDLGEDEDGQLYVSGFPGLTTRQGAVKFMQDRTTASGPGDRILHLTYQPVKNSEHLYWRGLYQPGSEWSRDRWAVTIPDPDGLIQAGDEFVMEYAYRDPATEVVLTYDDAMDGWNVLGRWDLDDSSGTVAHATVGSDGTYINAPSLGVTGLVDDGGTAVATAAGPADEITIPITGLPVAPTDPGWVAFWFKYGGATSPFSNVVFRDDTSASSLGYLLEFDGTDVIVRVDGVQHTVTGLASAQYLDGNRHMCVFCQDNREFTLFIDGHLVDSWTDTGLLTAGFWLAVVSPLHFGQNGTTGQYSSYTYDRIAVGAAVISEGQAAQVYAIGTGGA